jgi:hypothetical protein
MWVPRALREWAAMGIGNVWTCLCALLNAPHRRTSRMATTKAMSNETNVLTN